MERSRRDTLQGFGNRLKALRKKATFKQSELADMIFENNRTVSNWETKPSIVPSASQLFQICRALGCSADELLGLSPLTTESDAEDIETGLGIKWRVTRPHPSEHSYTKSIDIGIQVFRLTAKEGLTIEEIQSKWFSDHYPEHLRYLVKMVLFSRIIRIVHVDRNSSLEEQLLGKYEGRLRECIVADTSFPISSLIDTVIRTEAVAFLAAHDAIEHLPVNSKVGLVGGSTVARFIDLLPPASPRLNGITWVSLLSTKTYGGPSTMANDVVARAIYSQPGTLGYELPFIEREQRVSKSIQKMKPYDRAKLAISDEVIEHGRNVLVAFISVGSTEFNYRESDAHSGLHAIEQLLKQMPQSERQRCKGDIFLLLVDENGQRVGSKKDQEENEGLVHSIGFDGLRRITASESKRVWILANRKSKVAVIKGAINSGLANALVIDTSVAEALLDA